MRNVFTTQNLVYIGLGLATAFVVYNVLINRQKTNSTTKPALKSTGEESSDFCGCGA